MSYCRANGQDSDVYVMATIPTATTIAGWWCCGCQIRAGGENFFLTREGMIEHLLEHRKLGDKVPERAFYRLRREIRESNAE